MNSNILHFLMESSFCFGLFISSISIHVSSDSHSYRLLFLQSSTISQVSVYVSLKKFQCSSMVFPMFLKAANLFFYLNRNLYFLISYFEFDFPTDKVVTTIYVKSSFYPDIL